MSKKNRGIFPVFQSVGSFFEKVGNMGQRILSFSEVNPNVAFSFALYMKFGI
jgi:hypothetical protein